MRRGVDQDGAALWAGQAGPPRCRPHSLGHWKTVTFVAGLRLDGFIAPFVIDCAMNGAIFVEYLQQCAGTVAAAGDIVVIDNLPSS